MNKFTHSGNIILLVFGIMLVLMSFLVYKSMQEDVQMTSDNYYEQELKFQETIDAKHNADQYGEKFSIIHQDHSLLLEIPSELNEEAENVQVVFYCISNNRNDQVIKLERNTTGKYTIPTDSWNRCNYKAKISFEAENKKFYKELPVSI